MTIAGLFNSMWMWQCGLEAARYAQAAKRVERTQSDVLLGILSRNADTEYGRLHRFSSIRSARQFHEQVPVSNYEAVAESMQRIAAGQQGVLTREAVTMFEPTSGTSGPEKLIPYTRSLKRQFQRALSAWVWDTLSSRPNLRRGSSYWSLSPAFGKQRTTDGGIPIGFDDDRQYLSLSQRVAASHTLAVNPRLASFKNIDNFRYATLLQLLQASNLTMISVWSPTFLTALLEKLDDWWPLIYRDLARGTATLPVPDEFDTGKLRAMSRGPDLVRADYLDSILRSQAKTSDKFAMLWPSLGLISCWTDAAAARFVPSIRKRFPDVEIQPKGLIATEGIVSIPRVSQTGAALAIRSHFFEFQEELKSTDYNEASGPIRLAHELEVGRTYRVIITTGGGLYRYQLGDLIQVRGTWRQCPLIQFLGRSTSSSDLVGEKLQERHVGSVLQRTFAAEGIEPSFALLAPRSHEHPGYVLYLQGPSIEPTLALQQGLSKRIQVGLEENPHYRHAIHLQQLAEAKVVVLDPRGDCAWKIFERVCVDSGQRIGDIKPVALHPGTQWAVAFESAITAPLDCPSS